MTTTSLALPAPTAQVVRDISLGRYTSEELNHFVRAINGARKMAVLQAAHSFNVGDKVQFRDKMQRITQGVVVKVMQKNIMVYVEATKASWRVTATLLTKVA